MAEVADHLAALVLDCGRGTHVSGPTAAALHGFDGFRLKPPFHVSVVRGRNVQRAHHHVHTTIDLPQIDRATVQHLATMAPARTLIDMARFVTPVQLTAALDSALRDGLISEALLHRRLVDLRSRGRYGIPKLLGVIEGREASRGGHSWLERRFLELCAYAGLPRPDTQRVLSRTRDHVVRVDCRFPTTRVVVELLGYRWPVLSRSLARRLAHSAVSRCGSGAYGDAAAARPDHPCSLRTGAEAVTDDVSRAPAGGQSQAVASS